MRLFDLHCDTAYECYHNGEGLYQNSGHIDIVRGRAYDSWIQVFAVWMPDELRGEPAFEQCRKNLLWLKKELDRNSEAMIQIRTPAGLEQAGGGGCGAVLAIEGASALAGRLSAIEAFAAIGVRVMTITWNGSNELGHGCMSGCDEGLTAFGRAAVTEMERLGIIPDVSHLNEKGFWDVLENTNGPVIASHSVSDAVFHHERNLTDEQFTALCTRGGLVGLNLCGEHLGEQTFECFLRHLTHYISLGGASSVAIGCDFDGTSIPPEWDGISVMKPLYVFLQKKGYEEALLEQLFFGNSYDFFMRALTNA